MSEPQDERPEASEDTLTLSDGFYLSPVERRDKEALVEHLQAPEIARNTLTIPYPYTEADAESWIDDCRSQRERKGKDATFAIRTSEGTLVGAVGTAGEFEMGASHRAEVGYWLAKPYWGRGITTEALTRYARYAFEELAVVRLTAKVFVWNTASVRVLRKVGFKMEGRLRRHQEKDGDLYDVLYFGLLREDLETGSATQR